jgi:hypothetical protein
VRRLLAAGTAVLAFALALAWPGVALAHGLAAKEDLPVPTWLFAWASALVLVASFVAVSILWPAPRFTTPREKVVARVPAALEAVSGVAGVAVFAFCVYAGLAGSDSPRADILPTAVFVVFWIAIPFASVVLGDVFRPFNPWRAVARAAVWAWGRTGRAAPWRTRTYPAALGRWPATATILVFTWVELVDLDGDMPSRLGLMALSYALFQLVAMGVWGIDTWTARGDGFSVCFNLFGRLAPLDWRDGTLVRRRPLEGITRLSIVPGTVALVCTMIGSTTFDGVSRGSTWRSIAPHLRDAFAGLGAGATAAHELAGTVGLVVVVAAVAGIYRIGVEGMASVGTGRDVRRLSGDFVHTLVPIAFGYVVAHYFSLLLDAGETLPDLVAHPFGRDGDPAARSVVGSHVTWYIQVFALVGGHVCGIVLAHDRALTIFSRPRDAVRAQYWMLAVMVSFTCVGLWLLSQ